METKKEFAHISCPDPNIKQKWEAIRDGLVDWYDEIVVHSVALYPACPAVAGNWAEGKVCSTLANLHRMFLFNDELNVDEKVKSITAAYNAEWDKKSANPDENELVNGPLGNIYDLLGVERASINKE